MFFFLRLNHRFNLSHNISDLPLRISVLIDNLNTRKIQTTEIQEHLVIFTLWYTNYHDLQNKRTQSGNVYTYGNLVTSRRKEREQRCG